MYMRGMEPRPERTAAMRIDHGQTICGQPAEHVMTVNKARISSRTGKPVRKYVRRTAISGDSAPLPFLPDQALLRLRTVMQYTDLKRATIYLWMAQGRFPRPEVKIGTMYVVWTWRTIRGWLEAQIAS